MLSAMSAEGLKLRRHRGTWLLVWIFPIGAFVIPMIGILAQLAQGNPEGGALELEKWIENATDFWDAPPGGLGRMLAFAFIALVFAGEYGWNTWKLIVPHRARTTLLAAKYAVSLGLLYTAYLAAALIMMGMGWLEDVLTGDAIPEGLTAGALAAAHGQALLAGLPTVLMTVAYAGLAAILTRSTTAALVIGIVVITLEQLFRVFAPGLAMYLPGVIEGLYQLLPVYHLTNLSSWVLDGSAESVPFPSGEVIAYGWAASLAIVAAWLVALVGFTFFRFRRQDIN